MQSEFIAKSSPQRSPLSTRELKELINTERDRVNQKIDSLRSTRTSSIHVVVQEDEEEASLPAAPTPLFPTTSEVPNPHHPSISPEETTMKFQEPPEDASPQNEGFESSGFEATPTKQRHNDEFMMVSISPMEVSNKISASSSDEEDLKGVALFKDDNAPIPASSASNTRYRRMIPLAVGLAALTAVALGIYFFMDNNNVALSKSGAQNANYQGTVTGAELAAHNTAEDCWVLIGTTVHDLTEYAPKHPGGSRLITDLAGTDATAEYELEHPLSLMSTLSETIIGTIEAGYVPVRVSDDDFEDEEDDDDTPVASTTAVPPPVEDPPVEDPPVDTTDPDDTTVPDDTTGEGGTGSPIGDFIGGLGTVTAFISEIHYDNVNGDEGQMVEVAFSNHLDVSGYKVEFYRGKTGLVYNTESLQSFKIGASRNGLTFATRDVASFQNGVDGLALIAGNDEIVEFISYEGIMTAQEGYAEGMVSVDIGASQSGQDPKGWTLQKTGTGCLGDDFEWGINAEGTPGDANVEMTINCYADGAPVPAPAPWAETISPTATCFAEIFDLATVAEHGTPQSCWHAMFGVVYDYTEFINEHSGGPDDIVPNCGTDATEAYLKRHKRGLLRKSVDVIIGRLGDVPGTLPVSCERRLEHADSGYWDEEWESVEEFEQYVDDEEDQ